MLNKIDILIIKHPPKFIFMVMIYDITKTCAINSHQILSVFYENAPDFAIKVMVAAGKGSGDYGAYGKPITYTVYEKEIPFKTPDGRLADIKRRFMVLKPSLKLSGADLVKLKNEIADLEKEESDLLTNPEFGIEKKNAEKIAQQKFKKFVQLLSDPEFNNSKTPAEFDNIL